MRLTSRLKNVTEAVLGGAVPIIRTPVYLQNVGARARRRMEEKRTASLVESARRKELKKNPLIIQCKDGVLNHYEGQTYSKFDKVPLVSGGWKHSKSYGDYFTIKSYGKNPALDESEGSWEELCLTNALAEELARLGFDRPTSVQQNAIPLLLGNNHALISAETGSGKTLAYAVPLLDIIYRLKQTEAALNDMNPTAADPRVNRPFGIVVTPGRELSGQVASVFSQFQLGSLSPLTHVVTGGSFVKKMQSFNPEPVDLVVGTIGMLGKFFFNEAYDTSHVRYVIFDEADTLVDESFQWRTGKLLENFFNKQRAPGVETRLCFVGATIPSDLEALCSDYIPVSSIQKVISPHVHRVQFHVEQKFIRVSKAERAEKLLELVKSEASERDPMIIFSSHAATSDWVAMFLNENGVKTANYNSAMMKNIREHQFGLFRSGAVSVLSCTDLGSRGLDTANVKHIVNFDFPRSLSDYIHRCGRVGRVGGAENCKMTSFLWKRNSLPIVQAIEYAVRKRLPLDEVKIEKPERKRRKGAKNALKKA